MEIAIRQGWPLEQAQNVAELYEQAFGMKFARAIPNQAVRVAVLSQCFVPGFSFAAMQNGNVVGLAGFQTQTGALTQGMDAKQLIDSLGPIKGTWACAVLALFERKAAPNELVMDGIAVDSAVRGQGIGSHLLDAIMDYAQAHGFESVRLDVIDSNPRARKLYETKGFVATKEERFPHLKWLVGFSGATTMVKALN
ncbi:N-acetyltransferase [Salinivibrio sp. YCSC6]|uniref:GNAT family N-acetyltransferase n=1 Tax=Salinivibrio sp. YCSC6 TaxID=2003370 RepID=UPI000BBC9C03|nr:GNAT family N-acetyltransferase [Salinivibrio sp. YCSC6]PCE67080.1 molybdopterin-guanine dinucleotide biosynthesis protein MobC [Salinivibrio sp. YCSC6]QCF36021.1 GNAT family N-acetyltransferase [Salinivibrio sp. YCSC6]